MREVYIRTERGLRTKHYLIGISRDKRGMELFKEISARQSSRFDGSVPSMDHSPGVPTGQLSLFSAMGELEADLLAQFAGKRVTREEIYHEHHVGTPYCKANYREALENLRDRGLIQVKPPKQQRRSPKAIPGKATIIFPDSRAG